MWLLFFFFFFFFFVLIIIIIVIFVVVVVAFIAGRVFAIAFRFGSFRSLLFAYNILIVRKECLVSDLGTFGGTEGTPKSISFVSPYLLDRAIYSTWSDWGRYRLSVNALLLISSCRIFDSVVFVNLSPEKSVAPSKGTQWVSLALPVLVSTIWTLKIMSVDAFAAAEADAGAILKAHWMLDCFENLPVFFLARKDGHFCSRA